MRESPRLILATIVIVAGAALFAFGAASALIGFAEQRHTGRAYVVGFVGDADCDDAHELYIRVADGQVLDCVPVGLSGGFGRVSLPGFTDAQNEQVETMAQQLGSDGLSAAEQGEIQRRVDQLTATVPSSKRPGGDQAVWGAGRAWLGLVWPSPPSWASWGQYVSSSA